MRERIGNSPVEPFENIPLYTLEETVNNLLDLLAEHGIIIDFMGDGTTWPLDNKQKQVESFSRLQSSPYYD